MTVKLTKRQQQVLDIIRREIEVNGYPPTRVEISEELGFRSPNAAEDHLKALARKGAIELIPNTSRGIRLIQPKATLKKTKNTRQSAIVQSINSNKNNTYPIKNTSNNENIITLSVIGRVAAGNPVLATEHIEKELTVGAHLFNHTPDFLLRVRGLSMRDAGILEGDLLAVKKTNEIKNGQIIVARIGDEVTVKRLRFLENEKENIVLLSENPDYEPIYVSNKDDFVLEGIAVGLIRDWG